MDFKEACEVARDLDLPFVLIVSEDSVTAVGRDASGYSTDDGVHLFADDSAYAGKEIPGAVKLPKITAIWPPKAVVSSTVHNTVGSATTESAKRSQLTKY